MQEVVGGSNTAIIKVGPVKERTASKIKFNDGSNKVFNCNVAKYLGKASDGEPVFNPGRVIKVLYNLTEPTEPGRKPMRWINEVSLPDAGESLTWADKEPYRGNGGGNSGGGNRGGGGKKDGEFRKPEQIMRSTAIGVAVSYATGRDLTPNEVIAIAKDFYDYVVGDQLTAATEMVAEGLDATPVDDLVDPDDDIPF